ncbi:unnamed protein product [Lactuca virosa]|uniref:F-box domain-containing protein n=1 Tax=Lactuca virosa TaxID=75947 RepID=A0AAU9LH67_9ASTR|nr:unnamed protein product [Lactuca virosa]
MANERSTITSDNGDERPWSDLNHDLLLLVMMQLGVIDFLAFSGVCKPWRLIALSNKNKFLVSRPPMSLSFSTNANETECCLEDFEGRKFKTIVPHSAERTCIGVTCGYLILFGVKPRDFWLVNPITRHELHFPNVPFNYSYVCKICRAILVFSPSLSKWVFVFLIKSYGKIWFSIADKREWTHVSNISYICDLYAFKGKVYTLHDHYSDYSISELRLYPTPKLTLLESIDFQNPFFQRPLFVSSGENLYVMDLYVGYQYKIYYELDFDKMKCVWREKTGEKYACFFSGLSYVAAIILIEPGSNLHTQYKRYARYGVTTRSGKEKHFYAKMWYFFHEFFNE